MSSGSVSNADLILEIGSRSKIRCELKRHLSPRAVGHILRTLPLEGNAHVLGSMVYMETGITSGTERPRREFRRGDVVFLPANGIIGFFLADAEPGKTMSPIGRMVDDAEPLGSVRPGDVLRLYAA